MIRPLRNRHRYMIAGLTLLVPTIFALGLAARREAPLVEPLTGGIGAEAPDPSLVLSRQFQDTGANLAVRVSLVRSAPGSQDRDLVVELLRDPRRPELLVYWSGDFEDREDGLPADARFLGSVAGTRPSRMRLPDGMRVDAGYLVFYSLTQSEVLEGLKLRLEGATP